MNKKEIRHYVVCNLSYAATHALIETKLYSKVIANIVNCIREDSNIEVFVKNLNDIKYLGRFLTSAFFWHKTPEGYIHWSTLERKYHHYIIRF